MILPALQGDAPMVGRLLPGFLSAAPALCSELWPLQLTRPASTLLCVRYLDSRLPTRSTNKNKTSAFQLPNPFTKMLHMHPEDPDIKTL